MHYSTVKASIYFFHCQKEQELQNKKTQTSYTKNIIHPLEKTTIFDYNFFQCSHLTDLQNSLKEFSNKTHINSDVVIQLKERRLLYFLHSKERLCQSFDNLLLDNSKQRYENPSLSVTSHVSLYDPAHVHNDGSSGHWYALTSQQRSLSRHHWPEQMWQKYDAPCGTEPTKQPSANK